jgi:L-fuculose-phosphate aldolase
MSSIEQDAEDRQAVVQALQTLVAKHLTSGTAGNISVRTAAGMLITPTGVVPDLLLPEHIVAMSLDGQIASEQLTPSSEWQMHADVYHEKPGINAIVHCHSPYATILACAHKPIPALHYMVAAAGSCGIPLADYATFGSKQLSQANLQALSGSLACLLANHGQLATGPSLDGALKLAELVEEQAHCYWGTLAIGGPKVLNKQQMDDVLGAFASYGQQKSRKDLGPGNKLDE